MGKKVVIISSTMRKDGNSETLAKEFERGASINNEVEMIYLRDYEINFCKGCFACLKLNHCVIKDGATELMEKVKSADVLVFATPIYYYAVCGQLKTFLDRMNPIYSAGHNFKEVYLLTSAAEFEPEAMDGAIKDIEGWISCFDGVELKGIVRGNDANDIGDILKHKDKLEESYNMGKNV